MKTIGIFEAKTQFPRLCTEVEETRSPILVKRRGHPVVIISPVPPEYGQSRPDIVSDLERWNKEHGRREPRAEFPDVWKKRVSRATSPLTEHEK